MLIPCVCVVDPPEPDEVKTCSPFLWKQIEIIQPKVVLALGTFAAQRSVEWLEGMKGSLFFRPENVEFAHEATSTNGNTATGAVERVTFLGNAADVIVRCGEIALRARAHPTRAPKVGRQVSFSVPPELCIVFPA